MPRLRTVMITLAASGLAGSGYMVHNGYQVLSETIGEPSLYTSKGVPGWVHKMPRATRLALEMAVHEEDERRALEGELWRLNRAWREAEKIAAISDNLLLPKRAAELVIPGSGEGETPHGPDGPIGRKS